MNAALPRTASIYFHSEIYTFPLRAAVGPAKHSSHLKCMWEGPAYMDIHLCYTKMGLSFFACFHKAGNPLQTDGSARHGEVRFVRNWAGPKEASLLINGFGHLAFPSCAHPGGWVWLFVFQHFERGRQNHFSLSRTAIIEGLRYCFDYVRGSKITITILIILMTVTIIIMSWNPLKNYALFLIC